MRILFLGLAFLTIAASCNDSNMVKGASEQSDAGKNKMDVLVRNMDSSVSPSQDFFLYANGGWIKNNPIPPAYGSWGIGNLVIEENRNRLRELSEKAAAARAAKGSTEQKIGDFWATAMDSTKI